MWRETAEGGRKSIYMYYIYILYTLAVPSQMDGFWPGFKGGVLLDRAVLRRVLASPPVSRESWL